MANKLHRVLTQANVLIPIYLVMLWFSASSIIQYKTISILEDGFPGDAANWHTKGEAGNTVVTPDKIAVMPLRNTITRLGKSYELVHTNDGKRYVSISAEVISTKAKYVGSTKGQNTGSRDSLLYAWFGNDNRESIRIRTLSDLIHSDQRFKTSNILSIPKEAHYVNVEFLLRKFQTTHELAGLEVEQIKRTLHYKMVLTILAPIAGLYLVFKKIQFQISLFTITLVLALTLVLGVLLPGNALRVFIAVLMQIAPSTDKLVQSHNLPNSQNILHFLGFLLLTVVVFIINVKTHYKMVNCIYFRMLFADSTEVIQKHSIERSPRQVKILIDLSSLAVSTTIWFYFNLVRSNSETVQ